MSHTFRVRWRHPRALNVQAVKPSRYEFRVRGRLAERLLSSFEGFDAEIKPVETVLSGEVTDQAALHGVLEQIESLGLELVEVRQVDERRRPLLRDRRVCVKPRRPTARNAGRVSPDARIERLLRMAASLEEAIIRLEQGQDEQEVTSTIVRLRVMQGEILSAVQQLEGDFPRVD